MQRTFDRVVDDSLGDDSTSSLLRPWPPFFATVNRPSSPSCGDCQLLFPSGDDVASLLCFSSYLPPRKDSSHPSLPFPPSSRDPGWLPRGPRRFFFFPFFSSSDRPQRSPDLVCPFFFRSSHPQYESVFFLDLCLFFPAFDVTPNHRAFHAFFSFPFPRDVPDLR